MSGSSEFGDVGRFSGQKPARPLEKSNFSQTCSLLSQYLKEKGTFGDLSLGMTRNFETNGMPEPFRQTASSTASSTMNLFPTMEKSGNMSAASTRDAALKSMNFFPRRACFAPTLPKDDVPKKADSSVNKSEPEPGTAQMTIFYDGQVIVLNDVPADKANELMLLLASKGSSQNANNFASNVVQKSTEATNLIPSKSNVVPNFGNTLIQERVQGPPQPIVTAELPIARKASLTRFLEKRKDRITARAPYHTSNSTTAPSQPAESKTWLGLAAQSPLQFERRL